MTLAESAEAGRSSMQGCSHSQESSPAAPYLEALFGGRRRCGERLNKGRFKMLNAPTAPAFRTDAASRRMQNNRLKEIAMKDMASAPRSGIGPTWWHSHSVARAAANRLGWGMRQSANSCCMFSSLQRVQQAVTLETSLACFDRGSSF